MATPIGHSLLGLAVAQLFPVQSVRHRGRLYAFGIVAANAPDFDFLPGLVMGDMNLYHQGISHSVAAALMIGALGALCSNWLGLRRTAAFAFATLSYASHLLLDFFCSDGRPPFGQPLFWPVVDGHFIAAHSLFSGIRHGVPGDSLATVMDNIFSIANLRALGLELLLVTPLVIAWQLQKVWRNSVQKN